MLVKEIGIAAVMLSAAGLGLYKALELKARERALAELLELLAQAGTLIRYQAADTGTLIRALAGSGQFSRLAFLQEAHALLEAGMPAHEALLRAAGNIRRPLSPQDAEAFRRFAQLLGTRDIDGELEGIALCRASLEHNYEQARAAARDKGKLFCTLGILGGIFAAVMAL